MRGFAGPNHLIHDAIWDATSTLDDIKDIVDRFPECIKYIDTKERRNGVRCGYNGRTIFRDQPLHSALTLGRYDVAHFLLARYPEAARTVVHVKQLALHLLFDDESEQPPLELVKDIINAYPEALQTANPKASPSTFFPLNSALRWLSRRIARAHHRRYGYDPEVAFPVIIALFEKYPEAARVKHFTCGGSYDGSEMAVNTKQLGLIRMMAEALPEFLQTPEWLEKPFHRACSLGCTDIVTYMLEKGAGAALLVSPTADSLPIHTTARAMKKSSNHVGILRRIIQRAPESILRKDSEGRLPIHRLAENGRYPPSPSNYDNRARMGELLVELGPDSMLWARTPLPLPRPKNLPSWRAMSPGTANLLPIHIAASKGDWKLMKVFAENAPATLEIAALPIAARDGGGPPLHIALNAPLGPDTDFMKDFEFLLSHSPLAEKDHYRDNVLHIALHNRLPAKYLTKLLEELQRKNLLSTLVDEGNWLGRTPLHFSALTSLDCVKAVMNYFTPGQLRQILPKRETWNHQSTALHYCLHHPKSSWIEHKKRYDPNARKWVWDGIFHTTSDIFEKTKLLVEACPQSLLIKDRMGRTPLQIAQERRLPTEVTTYLAMSVEHFHLDIVSAAGSVQDNGNIAFQYLSKFVGEWSASFAQPEE